MGKFNTILESKRKTNILLFIYQPDENKNTNSNSENKILIKSSWNLRAIFTLFGVWTILCGAGRWQDRGQADRH